MQSPPNQPPAQTQAPLVHGDDSLARFPPKRWHLAVAALCVGAVYLVGVSPAWWPTPDSALYQGLGRNLVERGEFSFNGEVNNTVTPGLPAVLGVIREVFGESYWWPNLFMTLCGLGALAIAYATLRRWTTPRLAFAAVLATAVLHKYYDYSHLILTDAPFVLLFWAMFYACTRALAGSWAWLVPAAALTAGALTVRLPGLVVIGPLAAGVLLDTRGPAKLPRRLIVAACVMASALATAAGFYILARQVSAAPPAYTTGLATRGTIVERFFQLARGLWRLPGETAIVLTGQRALAAVGLLACLAVVAGFAAAWRRGRRLEGATWLVYVAGSSLLISGGAIRSRYMMPIYPLMLLALLGGVFWCVRAVARWRHLRVGRETYLKAAGILVGVLVAVNVPKMARDAVYYTHAAYRGRYQQVIAHGHYADLKAVARFLREHFDANEPIAVRADRVAMLHLLGGRKTVPFKKVDPYNPWSAAQGDEVYADLKARPGLAAVIHDRGNLDGRFANRLEALLAGDAELRRTGPPGRVTTIYVPRRRGPTTRPAARGLP